MSEAAQKLAKIWFVGSPYALATDSPFAELEIAMSAAMFVEPPFMNPINGSGTFGVDRTFTAVVDGAEIVVNATTVSHIASYEETVF